MRLFDSRSYATARGPTQFAAHANRIAAQRLTCWKDSLVLQQRNGAVERLHTNKKRRQFLAPFCSIRNRLFRRIRKELLLRLARVSLPSHDGIRDARADDRGLYDPRSPGARPATCCRMRGRPGE